MTIPAMRRRFDDKIVVITGAAGGIGRATAVRFASEGARLVLVDLFNNAGILGDVTPMVDYSEATFDRVMSVNAKSVWLGMKTAAPVMAAGAGGAIELIRRGIRVNAVCPAPIDTPMAELLGKGFSPQDVRAAHDRLTATIPMRRYGKPEEVAIYTVDGGAMA